jgi:5-methylcytosine-specific restriction endonuclease McrA
MESRCAVVTRARKICSEPSCPNFAPCPTHGRKAWAGSARDRGLQSVTGVRRQKRARYIIDRADTICALCGYPGADQIDHIIPLAHGGLDTIENCQPVHQHCHAEKSAHERQGRNPGLASGTPQTAATRTASDPEDSVFPASEGR